MSQDKRKRKKVKSSSRIKEYKEIIGISIIVFSFLITFSLFNFNMGIFGLIIRKTIFFIAGFSGYLFPIYIFITGMIIILQKFNSKEKKLIISTSIIFICSLIIFDGFLPIHNNFLDKINTAINLGQSGKGGGILGGFLGYIFYNLFGTIGTYLILSSVIIVNIIIITDLHPKQLFSKFNFERPVKKKPRLKKKGKPKINTIQTSKKNNVKILNYMKNELPKQPKLNVKEGDSLEAVDTKSNVNTNQDLSTYQYPSVELLKSSSSTNNGKDDKEILENAKTIEDTMSNFGIKAEVVQINRGPTITCYELEPAPGIKLNRIVSLSDNIALSLASSDIRIEAPIPGKAAVGIEVPNKVKDNVLFKDIILSNNYEELPSKVPLALGKDVSGNTVVSTIDKMPHLLIAGATGSGKSVCINTIIASILYKSSPNDVKLLLIDPKVVELNVYNGIPHLLIPVVTDAKKAASALKWAVEEMEQRYKKFAQNNVRDISTFNKKVNAKNKIPRIVIIIDELADLMMVAAQEIEDYICRLAQMARAAGMYLIVATQRPSVDVITGTIKANIPSRISFAVSSNIDSRTILDTTGAEKLLGKGDMLFYPSFYSKPARLQGAFISDEEVESIVEFLKKQNLGEYDEKIIDVLEHSMDIPIDNGDELLPVAINLVIEEGQASISLLQRRLRIGYTRAARIVDEMEAKGIVGGHEGSKPRKVLISSHDLKTM